MRGTDLVLDMRPITTNAMRHFSDRQLEKIRAITEWLALIAGIVLLVVLTEELTEDNRPRFSPYYLRMQLIVCIIFIADILVRMFTSPEPLRFLRHNIFFLLLSIPFLNIIEAFHINLPRSLAMLVGTIPLLRTLVVADTLSRWLTRGRAQHITAAYAMITLIFTYISALVFYDYEIDRNPHLETFGDAVWWAFMNLTTVGAAIFPVTTIGKVLAVILPTMGMLILPVFTAYITTLFARVKRQ